MAKRDKFEEVKIKLVMRLRQLSRTAAVAEIARMDAARNAPVKKMEAEDDLLGGIDPSKALSPNDEGDFMSAEEFFKDM